MSAMSLPSLREELDLLAGPVLTDGQPSWTLHDPQRNQFFRIDWLTFEILTRWKLASPELIAERVKQASALRPEVGDVMRVARFLNENQLTIPTGRDASQKLAQRLREMQGSPWRWLLHHYLFFRVPLLKPDRWLQALLPWVAICYSRGFFLATLAALGLGMSQVIRQSELFFATLVDTFSVQGLVAYGVTLVVVKFLHELGHAFTAKRFGCRIPAIGVGFLVLFPMAYTDTNEAWRLDNRWQRLQVSCAGIATELIIAAWATLAWALLPEGQLRGIAFMLATTSLVATLAINASPFLRFDGYFILSDLLDIPNLHTRSFALARWKLREWLFDLDEERPEYFSSKKQAWLIAFAWITWLYRLLVFIAIAILVYHFFIKAVGIFLFVVELWWFIALPVYREAGAWIARREKIAGQSNSRRRAVRSLVLMLAVIAVFSVPWPGRVATSGLLRPLEVWPIIVPSGAFIGRFDLQNAERVEAGVALALFQSPQLSTRQTIAGLRAESARLLAASSGLDEEARKQLMVVQQNWATAEAELGVAVEQMQKLKPVAPFAGTFYSADPNIAVGQWLAANEQLGLLVGDSGYIVETFLDEEQVKRVAVGDSGIFLADGLEGGVIALEVSRIDVDASRTLTIGELAAHAGGHVMTRPQLNAQVPERAVYRVELTLAEVSTELAGHQWRGKVVIRAKSEAPLARYMRSAVVVLVREFGF